MRVAIISIVDDDSDDHWSEFVLQVSNLFMPTAKKKFFLFSNRTAPNGLSEGSVWQKTNIEWSPVSLHAFQFPVLTPAILPEFDYVFHLSNRLSFYRPIGEEILPDSSYDVVAIQHPGFVNLPPNRLPFERNPKSAAYVSKGEGSFYLTDQVFGASSTGYSALTKGIQSSMDLDQRRIPSTKRRFETYLNGYLAGHAHSMRHSGYCYPSDWDLGVPKMILCDWNRSRAAADYWVSLDQGAPKCSRSRAA